MWGLAALLLAGVPWARAFDKDLTMTVQPGRTDCVYQEVMQHQTIDVEYQVIDSSQGELDISFSLADPVGRVLVAEYKKGEGGHRHTALVTGDYRLCFDNSFSTFATKTVYFDLMVEGPGADDSTQDYDDSNMELTGANSETYSMKVGAIAEVIERVRDNIARARRLQELHSAGEARDRNLAEETCARVLAWSLLHLLLMCLVATTQLVFVKALFDEKRSVKNFWTYLPLPLPAFVTRDR